MPNAQSAVFSNANAVGATSKKSVKPLADEWFWQRPRISSLAIPVALCLLVLSGRTASAADLSPPDCGQAIEADPSTQDQSVVEGCLDTKKHSAIVHYALGEYLYRHNDLARAITQLRAAVAMGSNAAAETLSIMGEPYQPPPPPPGTYCTAGDSDQQAACMVRLHTFQMLCLLGKSDPKECVTRLMRRKGR